MPWILISQTHICSYNTTNLAIINDLKNDLNSKNIYRPFFKWTITYPIECKLFFLLLIWMNKMYVTFRATKKAYYSPHTWRHFLHYLCWMRSVIHTCCFWRRAGVGQLIVFCIQYTKYKNITYLIYAYINYVYVSYICIYKYIGESSYDFTNIDMFILFFSHFWQKTPLLCI